MCIIAMEEKSPTIINSGNGASQMSDAATANWGSEQMGDTELKRTKPPRHESGAAGALQLSERTGSNQTIQTRLRMPSGTSIKPPPVASGTGPILPSFFC